VIAESPFERMVQLGSNDHAFAVWDEYPVSPGHALVVPKREVASIFDLDTDAYAATWELVREVVELLCRQLVGPHLSRYAVAFVKVRCDGVNVGVNFGEAAGQSVQHAHIHVIPRFTGDHPNPRGGVRAVRPGRSDYTLQSRTDMVRRWRNSGVAWLWSDDREDFGTVFSKDGRYVGTTVRGSATFESLDDAKDFVEEHSS
jgi:diadenosine tetraphosphate (Ap4A) HIT family hydrolase